MRYTVFLFRLFYIRSGVAFFLNKAHIYSLLMKLVIIITTSRRNFMHMLTHLVDYGIIGILIILSIIAVAVAIERFSFYKKINVDTYTTTQELESVLTSRLHLVATIGSNAPYIGLLGTVLGIMQTFYSMGANGTTNVNDIMAGLALALKATAAGLLVAIPSIVMYNLLHRRVNVLMLRKEAENERQKL